MTPPNIEEKRNPYGAFELNPLDPFSVIKFLIQNPTAVYDNYKNFTCAKKWADYAKFLAEKYIDEGIIKNPQDNPGAGNTWPWVHCMTNCYIQKYCEDGAAFDASLVKEFFDLASCLIMGDKGHCWSAFQLGDFMANEAGRRAGRKYQCCMQGCKEEGYELGRVEDPHGPFWWLRDWWDPVTTQPPNCCSPH